MRQQVPYPTPEVLVQMRRPHAFLALLIAIAMSLVLLGIAGCSTSEPAEDEADEATETVEEEEPEPEPLEPATYELVFEATWSAETHPTDFPGNPHFSGLIGAVHSEDAGVWEDGGMASPGIKNMAETGGKDPLDAEIQALIDEGTVCELISGGGVSESPGEAAVTFTATEECPLVSVVTMIAPSPDWFVGVYDFDLRHSAGGWTDEAVVELYPWDAGTDGGTSYASENAATDPPEPIFLMDAVDPVAVNGEIPPFGTFTITRVE
jgi:hypothetical protein